MVETRAEARFIVGGRRWEAARFSRLIAVRPLGHLPGRPSCFSLPCPRHMHRRDCHLMVSIRDQFFSDAQWDEHRHCPTHHILGLKLGLSRSHCFCVAPADRSGSHHRQQSGWYRVRAQYLLHVK